MFISYYTIIYFFVRKFFSNVYISVNTMFKCSYLSFDWEIGHPLSMYVTRRVEGGHPKCLQMCTGERGITLHVYVRTYTISFHVFVLWCLMATSHRFKGCHILYVFGLNSTVCSHIVGLHLVSWCWLILQFFTAFAYQTFLATFNVY